MAKIKLIYILSQRYSGSTLLSFLLGTHPAVATIGERRKFYTHSFLTGREKALNCSCGKLFPDCDYWNELKSRVLQRVDVSDYKTNPTEFQLSGNRYKQRMAYELVKYGRLYSIPGLISPFKNRLTLINDFNLALVDECVKMEKAGAFLDSSKSIEHVLFLSMIEALDIHVIWLARDPRAQVNSAMKYNDWNAEQATNYWKSEMRRNEQMLKKLRVKYMSLGYEALCHDPEAEMKNILEFLGLDPNGFSLDFRSQTQHIMGNYNMRLGKDSSITERKEWQSELTPDQRNTIEQMTRDYTRYYSKTT